MIQLGLREYLPLLLTIALWAVIFVVIGHADTARLFAATVAMRAMLMLTRLSTGASLRARVGAPIEIVLQAKRYAFGVQFAVLIASAGAVTLLLLGLDLIGQHEIAMFLPLIAIGLPARVLRNADLKSESPYSRLALSSGGLAAAVAGWGVGLGPIGMALAFGAREWIAYAVVRSWPKAQRASRSPVLEPMTLAEVARNTAVSGRRLLTYRISKVVLAMLGPVGNIAARTGRGLNWHSKIEPYLPHHLPGFILFALIATGGAAFLALGSGEPAAMVAAAAMMQLAAASTNIALMWRWLPLRDDPRLMIDEDEED